MASVLSLICLLWYYGQAVKWKVLRKPPPATRCRCCCRGAAAGGRPGGAGPTWDPYVSAALPGHRLASTPGYCVQYLNEHKVQLSDLIEEVPPGEAPPAAWTIPAGSAAGRGKQVGRPGSRRVLCPIPHAHTRPPAQAHAEIQLPPPPLLAFPCSSSLACSRCGWWSPSSRCRASPAWASTTLKTSLVGGVWVVGWLAGWLAAQCRLTRVLLEVGEKSPPAPPLLVQLPPPAAPCRRCSACAGPAPQPRPRFARGGSSSSPCAARPPTPHPATPSTYTHASCIPPYAHRWSSCSPCATCPCQMCSPTSGSSSASCASRRAPWRRRGRGGGDGVGGRVCNCTWARQALVTGRDYCASP